MSSTSPLFDIPTYTAETDTWGYTSFYSLQEFKEYILTLFKVPGEYGFDETSYKFNEEAKKFLRDRAYCNAPFKSRDFIHYWDTQKERCRRGVIYTSKKGIQWYLSRDYYMWLNFLPIINKETQTIMGASDTESFADVRDAQYHMALYELLAELHYKHAVVLKKRQIASSLFHAAKLLNQIWFEQGVTCKMGASAWDYINDEGTWFYLNLYRDFLNEHTAWYRSFKPESVGSWTQQIEITKNGRKTTTGLKSKLLGVTLEKSPTRGVGGAVKYFFYEEGGIAPTADHTYEFIRPALQSGMVTVGMFIIAGSVGDLKMCEPLKKFLLRPESSGFYGVKTNLVDAHNTEKICGLFIPEQWSMLPYIDKYGNSLVQESIEAIGIEREGWLADKLDPSQYQLRISQKPINIEEAFAYREESPFPLHLIQAQIRRIEENEYPVEYLDLSRDTSGKVEAKRSQRLPISEFPLSKASDNKEGVVVVYERPDKDLVPLRTYFASIDPLHTGKTKTSRSLCCIMVYKNPVEVRIVKEDGTVESRIEGDKIVCEWTGRLDDMEKVHERLLMIIEWYQAWTLLEYNGSFGTYMTSKNKSYYLVPSNQMVFNKEVSGNWQPNHPYGWKNVGLVFKTHILPYGIQFLLEEIDSTDTSLGNHIVTKYGVERLSGSLMLCKEMLQYYDGLNVDRIVTYCALMAFAKIQQAARGVEYRTNKPDKPKENKDLYKLSISPFRHIGTNKSRDPNMINIRNPFKHYR